MPAAEHFSVVHTIHLVPVLCIPHLGRRKDELWVGRAVAVVLKGGRNVTTDRRVRLKQGVYYTQNLVYKLVNRYSHVIFGVFTVVTMKNSVFWDVKPCGSCKNRCFGGT
jgi:hypothetical protein